MGNAESVPEHPFDGMDDEPPPQNDGDNHDTFYQGQTVPWPGQKYIGAYVSNPNPSGHPNEVELTVPALGKHKSFTQLFNKSDVLQEMHSASDPLDSHNQQEHMAPIPAPIGWGLCGCCCYSDTLFFKPRRALAHMFCWLNVFMIIYIFCALGLLSAMGELCSKSYAVELEPGFDAQTYDPQSNRFLQEYPVAAATSGEPYSTAAADAAESYDAKPAAASEPYAADAAAAETYKPHSAYMHIDSFSAEHVGPACNRLVSFLCVWSILMALATSIYGCCVFRHWAHNAHIIGFWMACILWMALDFFSIAIVFAVDAHNLHSIDHEMYKNHDRRLKASANYLTWGFDLELLTCVVCFFMSYQYLMFGLNLWRYSGCLLYDWNLPRPAHVDKGDDRLASEANRDLRQWKQKSQYYSDEFSSSGSYGGRT